MHMNDYVSTKNSEQKSSQNITMQIVYLDIIVRMDFDLCDFEYLEFVQVV